MKDTSNKNCQLIKGRQYYDYTLQVVCTNCLVFCEQVF